MASVDSGTIVLSLLLLLTNVYWMVVVHKLVNKLMSRNYSEYLANRIATQAKSARGPEIPKPETFRSPKENLEALPSLLGG
jgi:hypothetical protein